MLTTLEILDTQLLPFLDRDISLLDKSLYFSLGIIFFFIFLCDLFHSYQEY